MKCLSRLLPVWLLSVAVLGADSPSAPMADNVGFPAGYGVHFRVLRTFVRTNEHKVITVFGNTAAAGVTDHGQLPYPYGSIFVMETANALTNLEGKPVLDATGVLQRGQVTGMHVMRKEEGFGTAYRANQAGEWEFVEYRPEGSYLTPPAKSAQCAECHLKAGATKDFVYGGRFVAVKAPASSSGAEDAPRKRAASTESDPRPTRGGDGAPFFQERLIFPLQAQHVHSSCVVECPNGDLLACWFQGSGERRATDVAIRGARLRAGAAEWSAPFPMADAPEYPDLNPVLFIDRKQELWLFWITVMAERWEDSLLRYRQAKEYQEDGPPRWSWQDDLLVKPDDRFPETLRRGLASFDENDADYGSLVQHPFVQLVEAAKDLSKRERGWMPRTHLQVLPSGRILFPLYSDGYYVGLMAISDDGGQHWHASQPIVGIGLNQPTVVRKRDGTLVAYLRREGPPPRRVQLSTSRDEGETWTTAVVTDIPNPDSSLEVIALQDGRWVMAYNESEKLDDRSRLVLGLSDDEGATWKWKRDVESRPGGRFHYPSLIQARDGRLDLSYTYQPQDEHHRAIKHVTLDTDWIKARGQ